jgi:hypothetical protein
MGRESLTWGWEPEARKTGDTAGHELERTSSQEGSETRVEPRIIWAASARTGNESP